MRKLRHRGRPHSFLIGYLILKCVPLVADCLQEQRDPVCLFTTQVSLRTVSGYYSAHVPAWMVSQRRRGIVVLYLYGSCSCWPGGH